MSATAVSAFLVKPGADEGVYNLMCMIYSNIAEYLCIDIYIDNYIVTFLDFDYMHDVVPIAVSALKRVACHMGS